MSGKTEERATELTQIRGIGPAIARRLQDVGIGTLAQLAASSEADLAAALEGLAGMSASRIADQQWIAQAKAASLQGASLQGASEQGASEQGAGREVEEVGGAGGRPPGNGQRYATFKVDLLLEQDNQVRRTAVAHVQGDAQQQWAGWQPEGLLAFMQEEARVAAPDAPGGVAQPDVAAPGTAGAAREARPVLSGEPRLRQFEIVSPGAAAGRAQRLVARDTPFAVQLELGLDEVQGAQDESLRYTVLLHAKQLRNGRRQTIGPVHGNVTERDRLTVRIPNVTLQAGAYRLEAEVTLSAAEGGRLSASVPGSLLQVT